MYYFLLLFFFSRIISCTLQFDFFFTFVFLFSLQFDFSTRVLCPLVGETFTKRDMAAKNKAVLKPFMNDFLQLGGYIETDTAMVLQAPFDLTFNITRTLSANALSR